MADGPRRATFNTVQGSRARIPSWLPSARGRAKKSEPPPAPTASLKPPALPSEFVDAIRQELEPAPEARPRPSELPARPAAPVAPPVFEQPVIQPTVDPQLVGAFEHAIELLVVERARVLEQTASQLGELAAIIARRVIAHEISLDPGVVAGLVREGLEALGAHDRVVVRLGRSFAEACDALEARLAERGARADVRVDDALPEYGCVVETELGRVDESIETRIATLLEALKPDSDRPRGSGA